MQLQLAADSCSAGAHVQPGLQRLPLTKKAEYTHMKAKHEDTIALTTCNEFRRNGFLTFFVVFF